MDALSPPTKRARRGTRVTQAEDALAVDVPERRTRASGKSAGAAGKKSASKKGKAGSKKGGRGSGKVISASDWGEPDSSALQADGEFPSRSGSEVDIDFDAEASSDASEDEDFDVKCDASSAGCHLQLLPLLLHQHYRSFSLGDRRPTMHTLRCVK